MSKQDERVKIEKVEDEIVELRYFEQSKGNGYYSWKMPLNEANDLARWWENEGVQIMKRQLPIVERKFGSILISMFKQSSVEMRTTDQYGRTMFRGYSLPRKVVEYLIVWLQDGQHSQKSSKGMEAKACSTRCL